LSENCHPETQNVNVGLKTHIFEKCMVESKLLCRDNLLCQKYAAVCLNFEKYAYSCFNRLMIESLAWLTGAVVCLLAADRGSNCLLARATDDRIVCCGITSSCQSNVEVSGAHELTTRKQKSVNVFQEKTSDW